MITNLRMDFFEALAVIQYSTFATSRLHYLDDEVDVGFSQEAGGHSRVAGVAESTLVTTQVHTNQGVPAVLFDYFSKPKHKISIYPL